LKRKVKIAEAGATSSRSRASGVRRQTDSRSSFTQLKPEREQPRLSWRGRIALGLFGTHLTLLFFPPIPPIVKGSLWSYVLAYLAVVFGALELRLWVVPLAKRWAALTPGTRAALAAGTALWMVMLGLLVRASSPALYARWVREEGVWEPLTVLAYIAGGLTVLGAARLKNVAERNHLRLIGAVYLLIAAEEMDYFGIFGGFIGRIDGIYVGSPHDLLRLWSHGLLGPLVAVAVLATLLTAAGILWWRGYLQPARLVRELTSPAALWLLLGAALIGVGAADDAGIWHLPVGEPALEELLEFAGALCVLTFGLEVTSRAALRPGRTRSTAAETASEAA
jgi:hypothetical protein